MVEITTSTGAKVIINSAPFRDAMTLKNAIQATIKVGELDLSKIKSFKELDIAPFLESILAIDSDLNVYNALMKCLVRCTYNSEKITENTFETDNARQDYYEIVLECMKVNLHPFLKGLIFKLQNLGINFMPSSPTLS